MKKVFVLQLLLLSIVLFVSSGAEARMVDVGAAKEGKLLISNGCIMAYTDVTGNVMRVIRGNPVVVHLK